MLSLVCLPITIHRTRLPHLRPTPSQSPTCPRTVTATLHPSTHQTTMPTHPKPPTLPLQLPMVFSSSLRLTRSSLSGKLKPAPITTSPSTPPPLPILLNNKSSNRTLLNGEQNGSRLPTVFPQTLLHYLLPRASVQGLILHHRLPLSVCGPPQVQTPMSRKRRR